MGRHAVVAVLALSACTSVHYVATNPSPRPLAPRDASTVQVFTSTMPTTPFVEVGIITARSEARDQFGQPLSNPSVLVEALRKKGAEIGCDGIVVRPGTGYGYEATCLVYKRSGSP